MRLTSPKFLTRTLLATLLCGIVVFIVKWPNVHFFWQSRRADFSILRLGQGKEDDRYFKINKVGTEELAQFIQRYSQPIRLPRVASANAISFHFFDAGGDCIYCARILGAFNRASQLNLEMAKLARSGEAVSEADVDELFTAGDKYPIATRRATDAE